MRKPARHRSIAITIVLASAAALVVALEIGDTSDDQDPVIALFVGGLMGVIFGLVYAINAHLNTVRYRRLLNGEGVIARWVVNAQIWRLFNEAQKKRVDERPDGVEVIVGESSAAVDGDFDYLAIDGSSQVEDVRFVDMAAPYLEYDMRSQTKNGTVRWQHRVPVGLGAREKALAVVESYRTRLAAIDRRSIAERYPGGTRTWAVVVTLLSAAAGIIGLLIRESIENEEVAIGMMIGSIMLTPIALIFAIVAHVKLRRLSASQPPPPARTPRDLSPTQGTMPPPERIARDVAPAPTVMPPPARRPRDI